MLKISDKSKEKFFNSGLSESTLNDILKTSTSTFKMEFLNGRRYFYFKVKNGFLEVESYKTCGDA